MKVTEVLGHDGVLARAMPGWEPRAAQLDMALAVEASLKDDRPLVVEAGTGTGKTLAYLVPAILSGRKVVISTGTKNLQEQILKKDLPLLATALGGAGIKFTAASLKGIANYLCLRRFRAYAAMQKSRILDDEGPAARAIAELESWADRTRSGDRAEMPALPDDSPLWREVSSTTETRLGARCPHFEDCFVTRARRAAQAADLLIVNHHLFFADLSLKKAWPNAQLLPAYEAAIFDEAHQLEDVATDYFGLGCSSLRITRLAADLRRAADDRALPERAAGAADHLEARAEALWIALRPRLPRDGRAAVDGAAWQGEPTTTWLALDDALAECAALCAGVTSAEVDDDRRDEAEALGRRAQHARDDLAVCAERDDRRMVFWAETRGRSVFLNGSPVDVAEPIREHVLGPVPSSVFTSATLTTAGRFDYVKRRLGLEAAAEARLHPPFDYARQALLYLPTDLPEPSDPTFAARAAERVEHLVAASRGRAFLLFTSHRMMSQVHGLLAARLPFQVLLQGAAPKHLLVEEFRARPSVLFATASFWEGVDVQGEALSLVVIDKLPFAPPDNPLVAARVRRIAEDGGDGFGDYQVPQAALALAQGFGRLIRARDNRGVVAILDRRVTTRGYGRRVLGSLPPACPRTAALDDVQAFFTS